MPYLVLGLLVLGGVGLALLPLGEEEGVEWGLQSLQRTASGEEVYYVVPRTPLARALVRWGLASLEPLAVHRGKDFTRYPHLGMRGREYQPGQGPNGSAGVMHLSEIWLDEAAMRRIYDPRPGPR